MRLQKQGEESNNKRKPMTRSMEMSGGGTAVRGQSRYQNGVPGMQQSRLQMLQVDFQKKLLKEKEEKLVHLCEENQQRALERINNRQNSSGSGLSRGGSVREFFNERRILNAHGKGGMPPIQQHYSRYQNSPSGSAKTYHSSASYQSTGSNKTYNSAYSGRIPQSDNQNSAGRDRANPLAPLGQRQGLGSPQSESVSRKAPVPPIQQKPRLYQRKPGPVAKKPDSDQNGNRIYQGQIYQGGSRNSDFMADNDDQLSPSPPVNPRKKGSQLRQPTRRDNYQSQSPGYESPQKLTDFQKWQLEQNRAREERLQRIKSKPVSDVDEQDSGIDLSDEIRKRKEEIQVKLQSEQAELQKMQVQRQQKEEKDRQRKARQERAERERERRLDEQRERQREAEEERQRLQEERRLAEKNRIEEEEKRRNSQMSHRSRGSTHDNNTPRSQPPQRRAQPNKPRRAVHQERRQSRHNSPPPFDAGVELASVPGPGLDIYEQAANDAEAYGQAVNLAPCKVCGRKFARDRLPKHQQACKNISKPRKVFDPVKMRTGGTEAAQYVRSNRHIQTNEAAVKSRKKTNWRSQHESFIQSIRYAKKMSEYEAGGGKLSDLPPPPPSDTSSYVQCPHCNRRFNQSVAERHIPKCVNIRAKPRPPPNKRR